MSEEFRLDYDLSKCPASYDFLNWLINAEVKRRYYQGGPLRVRFVPGPKDGFRNDDLHQPVDQRQAILDHVMRPALKLIGAEETDQPANQLSPPYGPRYAVESYRAGHPLPQWHVPDGVMNEVRAFLAGRTPIVITLREASYYPERNSNVNSWLEFAAQFDRVDTLIIRDTAKADTCFNLYDVAICPRASKDLLFRAAIMAQARVNLMVSNGPNAIAMHLSGVPWLQFKPLPPIESYIPCTPEFWHNFMGVPIYTNYPWGDNSHRIVWKDDTMENIAQAFDEMDMPEYENVARVG